MRKNKKKKKKGEKLRRRRGKNEEEEGGKTKKKRNTTKTTTTTKNKTPNVLQKEILRDKTIQGAVILADSQLEDWISPSSITPGIGTRRKRGTKEA